MNKAELVDAIAAKLDCTKKQAGDHLGALVDVVSETLETAEVGDSVAIMGFGKWKKTFVKGREAVNPRNPKETMTLDDSYRAVFSAGKDLKVAVNHAPKKAKKKGKKGKK